MINDSFTLQEAESKAPMDDNDAVLAEEEQMLDEFREEVDEGSAELEQENELVCHEFLSDNGDAIDDNEEDVE